jgi:hypothetical protein
MDITDRNNAQKEIITDSTFFIDQIKRARLQQSQSISASNNSTVANGDGATASNANTKSSASNSGKETSNAKEISAKSSKPTQGSLMSKLKMLWKAPT